MKPFKSFLLLWCTMGLVLPVNSDPVSWKQRLEKAYARAHLGAELKYVDGLLANRAPDYQVLAPTGQRMDLSVERGRFEKLFEGASRVRFDTKILNIKEIGPEAVCVSEQVLTLEKLERNTGQYYTELLITHVADHWRMIEGKPRQLASRVFSQRLEKGPALIADSRWPLEKPTVGTKKKP